MSRRRRRNAINYNEDDDSENEVGRNYALDIFLRMASISTARGKTPTAKAKTSAKRKKSTTSTSSPRAARGRRSVSANASAPKRSNNRNQRNLSVVSIDSSPADDGEYEDRVRNRVNSHFKSSVLLISDDEDEVTAPVVKPTANRFSKDLYVLSDSDDDALPSTSIDNNPTPHSPEVQNTATSENLTAPATTTADSNRDELLEVVNEILDCTDTPDKAPDTVEDWKAKTDELIGNVNAIMEDLYKMTGKKQEEEPKQEVEKVKTVKEAPPKEKTSCPVCFEVLGGEIRAATTFCGHVFCLKCITEVAKCTKKCPTCRKAVTAKKIVPIYL